MFLRTQYAVWVDQKLNSGNDGAPQTSAGNLWANDLRAVTILSKRKAERDAKRQGQGEGQTTEMCQVSC